MHLFLGQTAQIISKILVADLGRLIQGQAFNHLGKGRGRGDSAGAAEGFEFGISDAFIRSQFQKKFKGVPAGQGADLTDSVGIGNLTNIAGIHKMITYLIRIIPHGPVSRLEANSSRFDKGATGADTIHYFDKPTRNNLFRPKNQRKRSCLLLTRKHSCSVGSIRSPPCTKTSPQQLVSEDRRSGPKIFGKPPTQ